MFPALVQLGCFQHLGDRFRTGIARFAVREGLDADVAEPDRHAAIVLQHEEALPRQGPGGVWVLVVRAVRVLAGGLPKIQIGLGHLLAIQFNHDPIAIGGDVIVVPLAHRDVGVDGRPHQFVDCPVGVGGVEGNVVVVIVKDLHLSAGAHRVVAVVRAKEDAAVGLSLGPHAEIQLQLEITVALLRPKIEASLGYVQLALRGDDPAGGDFPGVEVLAIEEDLPAVFVKARSIAEFLLGLVGRDGDRRQGSSENQPNNTGPGHGKVPY